MKTSNRTPRKSKTPTPEELREEQFKFNLTRLTSTIAYAIRTGDVPATVPGGPRLIDLTELEKNARELAKVLRDRRLGK